MVLVSLFCLFLILSPIFAELQNVEVGGSIRLRWNYIGNHFNTFVNGIPQPQLRIDKSWLGKRPIGSLFGDGVWSIYDWDDAGKDLSFVEQRTRLNISADFTDNVRTFIELDSYDIWGEDFRSVDYISGVDSRQVSIDDVEVFQAYIEAREMWGTPLRLRVGRQEMSYGSQFLVGPRDFAFFWTGISFDAVRLTYQTDLVTIDAWTSKLAESYSDFWEDDLNFHGVYLSYTGIEDISLDAYWMLLEDDRPIEADKVKYDDTMLHTVGIRAAGKYNAFDFDAEFAYQFGEADTIGKIFQLDGRGDNDADFDNWALKLDVGYTFDFWRQPRLFASFRYFDGEDNRSISFWDWINPFYRPEASISFNRLFSNEIASGALDLNNDLSNAWWVRLGVNSYVTDKLRGIFCVTYYECVDEFERPAFLKITPWWTKKNDDYLGTEVTLFLEYQYSEDLVLEAGWSHLFTGDGLAEGQFIRWNGLAFTGGTDDNDADYVYAGCRISF